MFDENIKFISEEYIYNPEDSTWTIEISAEMYLIPAPSCVANIIYHDIRLKLAIDGIIYSAIY